MIYDISGDNFQFFIDQLNDDSVVALGVSVGGSAPTRQEGSGFFFSAPGYLGTCHHVIVDTETLKGQNCNFL